MQIFYSTEITEEEIILDRTESHHCISVLRHKTGDEVVVTDGKGHRYQARIISDNHKACKLEVLDKRIISDPFPVKLHLVVAPVKSGDRIELIVEKCTEIGVSSIRFINCQRSERKEVNTERMEKIAISAMKQSLKFRIPQIPPMVSLRSFLKEEVTGSKLIGWCEADSGEHLLSQIKGEGDVYVLIGPEGDFTNEEVDLAKSAGYVPVSLGESRLRTETAAIVACALVQSISYNH